MKEITRIEKVYDFNELSESAKENARREYLDFFHEPYMFTETCNEKLNEDFPNSKLETQYSLSYCQGDGLNIYGQFAISDIINFIRTHYKDYDIILNHKQKRFMSYLEKQDIQVINRANSHYCYYTSKANDIAWFIEIEMEGNYYRDIPYDTINIIVNMFDICFEKYCKDFEDEGYDFFYKVDDDDEITEIWEINEYLGFTENGKPVFT